jgi:ABC-type Mn2+/Zn2+ transport system ATPase subunit
MFDETSPVIELDKVRVSMDGQIILEDITFQVGPGRFVGIIGPNGAGKTTLLKVILGLLPPTSGEVRLFGMTPAETLKKGHYIGYVPQRSALDRDLPFSVMDVILMGRVGAIGPLKWFGRKDRADAEKNLRLVEPGLCDRPIGDLRGHCSGR